MGEIDPYSYESMELPDDFTPDLNADNLSNEQWIILAIKMIHNETACMFEHFKTAMEQDDQSSQIAQEELYRVMKHVSGVTEGLHGIGLSVHSGLAVDTVKQLLKEAAEEKHGVEFTTHDVRDEDGELIGIALKAVDGSKGLDDITTWLSQQHG